MVQEAARDRRNRVSSSSSDQGSSKRSILLPGPSNDAFIQASGSSSKYGILGEGGSVMELSSLAIQLVSSEDLANALGFSSANDSFRGFCRAHSITPVRRNPHFFDPKLVRLRLDEAQGLESSDRPTTTSSYVAARRAKRARLSAS